jgi:hypothetical protein
VRSFEYCEALLAPSELVNNIDFIVYVSPYCSHEPPLTFSLLKDNWIKVRTDICRDPAFDPTKNYDWNNARLQWNAFIASFRYHGIVARDADFTTCLYTREGDSSKVTSN